MEQKGETREERMLKKERDTQPFSTHTLIVKVDQDAVTRVQNPPVETITLAKEEVDANEK